MPTTYSFSRVTTFEQCARRFRYRYIDGVQEAFQSVEGFVGRQVHSTLEWLFAERVAGREQNAEQAVAYYCDIWDTGVKEAGSPVKIIREGRSYEDYRLDGARMVESFHKNDFAGDRLETVAVEHHFTVELDGGHSFQGFIDRLARGPGDRLCVIDYKTSKNRPRSFSGKDADQLRAYAVALFKEHPDSEEMDLRLDYLRHGTSFGQTIDRPQAREFETVLADRIGSVETSTVYPPVPGRLCDWCGYNDICEGPRRKGPARD